MARCPVGLFYEWLYGKTKPEIENLLRAWYHLKLPVSLIFSPSTELPRGIRDRTKVKNEQKARPKRSRKQLQGVLQTIEPIFQQAIREIPPPTIHEVCQRIGLLPASIKEYAPGLCNKLKVRRREYAEECRADILNQLKAALHETPPPSQTEIYARLGITQSIALHNFPDLRRSIIVRHPAISASTVLRSARGCSARNPRDRPRPRQTRRVSSRHACVGPSEKQVLLEMEGICPGSA